MPQVFVSFSNKDRKTVEKIVEKLENAGIDCWFSPKDIVSGLWSEEIVKGIDEAPVFLLFISHNSMGSEQVKREIALAEAHRNIHIIPYQLENCQINASAQHLIAGQQIIYHNDRDAYSKLNEAIRRELGRKTEVVKVETHAGKLFYENNKKLLGVIALCVGAIMFMLGYIISGGKPDNGQQVGQEVEETIVHEATVVPTKSTDTVSDKSSDTEVSDNLSDNISDKIEGACRFPQDAAPYSQYVLDENVNVSGTMYKYGISFNVYMWSDDNVAIKNDGDYDYLRVVLGVRTPDDNMFIDSKNIVSISFDGKKVDSRTITIADAPEEIILDVKGVKDIVFQKESGGGGNNELTLADMAFYNEGIDVPSYIILDKLENAEIDDIPPYAWTVFSGYANSNHEHFKPSKVIGDKTIFYFVSVNQISEGVLFANPGKMYSTLTFKVGIAEDDYVYNGNSEKVYLDGEEALTMRLDGFNAYEEYTLDISDAYSIRFDSSGVGYTVFDMIWN